MFARGVRIFSCGCRWIHIEEKLNYARTMDVVKLVVKLVKFPAKIPQISRLFCVVLSFLLPQSNKHECSGHLGTLYHGYRGTPYSVGMIMDERG